MFERAVSIFWPDLKGQELKKFSLLATIFSLIIGSYWLLRLLKNTLLYKIAYPVSLGWSADQGRLMQPVLKFWSPFVVIALVLIYSKLVDLFEKDKLFYIICTFYTLLFGAITITLAMRHFWGDAFLGRDLLSALGWVSYFTIESFGSLVVALFWSFTASITDSESAKRGYPIIATFAQFGALIGSVPILFLERIGGIWRLFLVATIAIIGVMFLIRHFMRVTPESQMIGNKKAHATEKKEEGFFEGFYSGLLLLVTRPYLLGVLIVSTMYEIISQIVEYQMQSNAYIYPEYSSEAGFAKFQGIYGIGVNSLSFLMALLGISYMMKRFGLRFCLFFFPVSLGIAVILLYAFFNTGPTPGQLLWATFAVMMVAKGLGYAVNNPVKEIMYIPTSKDVKFKSKGWIDTFGSRTAKQAGAGVTDAFKHNLTDLMFFGTMFSLGLTGLWLVAAFYVGLKNK
ncbi:MAG TPA: Npt1/Npt2 family nucleotide transporter, partial [Candidatus Babeliales bacterium]|nr:Npt1/Npt2 family nucleotide transporter [Candidatus Babeliales bacterium]